MYRTNAFFRFFITLLIGAAVPFILAIDILVADEDVAVDGSITSDAFFEREIRPFLKKHCVQCHGKEKQASGLRLDARSFAFRGGDSGPVLVPNQSHASELWLRIQSEDDSLRMPPEGEPLSSQEKELIRDWIDRGAPWIESDEDRQAMTDPRREHWAWKRIASVAPPAPTVPEVSEFPLRNTIDRFVLSKLAEQGLQPSPEADRRTLIRRLSFDLLGLPPTPDQVAAFELDTDPLAYEKLVDRMLESPQYGERAAQHWLDISHFADTHGFERDQIREHAWRYRDWVIRALNEDMPYDRFVRLQIAGDAMEPDNPQAVIATGFLAAGPWDFVGQVETPSPVLRRLARADDLDDMLTQVLTATCAVTINCARCHDHKLDPISQKEYYSLASVFAGTKRGNRSVSQAESTKLAEARNQLSSDIQELKRKLQESKLPNWDLADIVGGGNGLKTGQANQSIDPATGQVLIEYRGFLENAMPNRFMESPLKIIDGVAIPDGGELGNVTVSSTGLVAQNIARTSGKSWDAIRNGPVHSQFSNKLAGLDVGDGSHSVLGMHSNSLVTFDLTELPNLSPEISPINEGLRLRGSLGYFGQTPKNGASVLVLVDGSTAFRRERLGRDDGISDLDIVLPKGSRFLTLMVTDLDQDISHDQVCFINCRLEATQAIDPEVENAERERVASIQARIADLEKQIASLVEVDQVYAVQSETPPAVQILARGDTEQGRDEVTPSSLECLEGLGNFSLEASASDLSRRLALSDWITDTANPLFKRVIVNRLWQQHFGQGIVATPSDFGLGGALPTHPELLDWLANDFHEKRYSLKAMHRLICCSSTYRQQSILDSQLPSHAKSTAVDANNRWLWRQNAFKLDAESTRDAVLAVSGQLEPSMFGPGFREFDYKEEYAPVYSYVTRNDREANRRSIYRFRVRTTPNPWLTSLDCPNSANFTPTRFVTTTALQSLALLNHDFVLQQSENLANRISSLHDVPKDQIAVAWSLVFSRKPSELEMRASEELIGKHGLSTFCRYLLNSNEFVSID
jgi:hypothetical protein